MFWKCVNCLTNTPVSKINRFYFFKLSEKLVYKRKVAKYFLVRNYNFCLRVYILLYFLQERKVQAFNEAVCIVET